MCSPADIELSRKHFEERLKVTLGPVELQELMDEDRGSFTLVDVRSKEGYQQEHIPSAINIPESELESRLQEIPKDKPVVVYCWTLVCHLAAHAGLKLAEHGYFARELEGGIQEWKHYKMPLAQGNEAMAGIR
jgi:rhodanese-related sulfurtransferase